MTFHYHPEAAKELLSSVQYYEEASEGLGSDFLDEIELAIKLALANPKTGAPKKDMYRRILLNRFPYEVIYDFTEESITIIAIKHLKRKPGYWDSRK